MRRFDAASWCGAVLVLGSLLSPAAEVVGKDLYSAHSIDHACEQLAEAVKQQIESGDNGRIVAVGAFSASANLQSAAGVGLSARIQKALASRGVTVGLPGDVQLSGEFFEGRADPSDAFRGANGLEPVTDGDAKTSFAIRIEFRLRDKGNRELHVGIVNVFGSDVLELAGGTATIPAVGAGDDEEYKRIDDAIAAGVESPAAVVIGAETRPDPGSPFGVVIAARPGKAGAFEQRAPRAVDGRSFVVLSREEEYLVRVRNGSSREVLVAITIDGLSPFTFTTDERFKQGTSYFVVAPGATYDVPGWFITTSESRAFEVSGYADSEAFKRLGASQSIGQISVAFFESKTPGERPVARGDRVGTKLGQVIRKDYTAVQRVPGQALATITVRYDKAP